MNNNQSNYFVQLSEINVNDHLEKKGQFSYLSWPYAVKQLRVFDESAIWEVRRFDGLPFLCTDFGTFVEVSVTVKNITLSQIHPVLDNQNKPLLVPSAFDINTSIQRCLVKAIALHGLGLNVYAGEDLPHSEAEVFTTSQPRRLSVATLTQSNQNHGFRQTVLLTENQLRYIKRLIVETQTDEAFLLECIGFSALSEIPKHAVNRVIELLESNRNKEVA